MTDLPDWTSPVQQSGSAYRGKVHVVMDGSGAASAVLDFELNTLDRAVLVFTPPLGAGISASVIIKALGPPSLITRQSEYVSDRRLVVGYASVELGTTWRVQVNVSGPGANTYDWQVFTDQLLPIQELVYTPDYLALADNVAVPALPAFGWVYDPARGLWDRAQGKRGRAVVQGQPDPIWVSPNFVDTGGGVSKRTVVAVAPGAGFRHRVVQFSLLDFDVAAGGASMEAWLDCTDAGQINLGLMGTDKNPSPHAIIPSPGMQVTTNTPLVVYTRGGAVGQFVVISLAYFTDPV